MTLEAQRIAIAEACGWTKIGPKGFGSSSLVGADSKDQNWPFSPVPDYLNSLDAMHEVEKALTTREQQADYSRCLIEVLNRDLRNEPRFIGPSSFDQAHATAAQRAEAFLRTLGKWEDGK